MVKKQSQFSDLRTSGAGTKFGTMERGDPRSPPQAALARSFTPIASSTRRMVPNSALASPPSAL